MTSPAHMPRSLRKQWQGLGQWGHSWCWRKNPLQIDESGGDGMRTQNLQDEATPHDTPVRTRSNRFNARNVELQGQKSTAYTDSCINHRCRRMFTVLDFSAGLRRRAENKSVSKLFAGMMFTVLDFSAGLRGHAEPGSPPRRGCVQYPGGSALPLGQQPRRPQGSPAVPQRLPPGTVQVGPLTSSASLPR